MGSLPLPCGLGPEVPKWTARIRKMRQLFLTVSSIFPPPFELQEQDTTNSSPLTNTDTRREWPMPPKPLLSLSYLRRLPRCLALSETQWSTRPLRSIVLEATRRAAPRASPLWNDDAADRARALNHARPASARIRVFVAPFPF